ncbi:MAG: hypothetical protein OXD30_11325 [Bryobacterales bacterium]|nr:hypothetical protein [Bryobacterales bacterium]
MSETIELLRSALASGEGVLRLAPAWVPRSFLMPGGRLKLHPADIYALGAHRGGIDERWFSSTTNADNGPGTPNDEGLSYIVASHGDAGPRKVLLKAAVDEIGDEILGSDVMSAQGGWNVLCKFFDNLGPIPHHMHQDEEAAARVGRRGKPEAYYFPPQYNYKENNFAYTFMGLEPSTTKDDIRRCLERWNEGDNGILYHSKAYKLKPGTGWQIPAGVLHAPGSAVTYEPQVNSDVFGMFQSMVEGRYVPWDLLVKDVPPEHHQDLEYIIGMLDWEANVDPNFMEHRHFAPRPARAAGEMAEDGYSEAWVTYSTAHYSAKELTVHPGRSATIRDAAAYGTIVTQGRGKIGVWDVHTPAMIRFGELTADEYFVTAAAAREGVRVTNLSSDENLVMLKHFGPDNPDARPLVRQ